VFAFVGERLDSFLVRKVVAQIFFSSLFIQPLILAGISRLFSYCWGMLVQLLLGAMLAEQAFARHGSAELASYFVPVVVECVGIDLVQLLLVNCWPSRRSLGSKFMLFH